MPVQIGPEAHPASGKWELGLSWRQSGRNVVLTTHTILVPYFERVVAIPPLPFWSELACHKEGRLLPSERPVGEYCTSEQKWHAVIRDIENRLYRRSYFLITIGLHINLLNGISLMPCPDFHEDHKRSTSVYSIILTEFHSKPVRDVSVSFHKNHNHLLKFGEHLP